MVSNRLRRWLTQGTGWRRDLKSGVLGALSALALPPLHLVPVLLLTVPALLILLDAAPRLRSAVRVGFWFGVGHHLLGLYWITDAILIEAAEFWWFVPVAVPALSAVLALFIAAACGLAWFARPGWRRVLALAGAWVLADLGRQFVATGFPWNLWGSVWTFPGAAGDVMIQPAAWVSVHGLTLATLLLAGTPRLAWRGRLAGALGFAAWIGLGAWRLASPPPVSAPPDLRVVLVQANIPEGEKQSRAHAIASFERHLDLTRAALTQAGAAHVVVWPETASPFLLETDIDARQAIAEAAAGPAMIGSVRFVPDAGVETPRNSLFALTAQGEVAGVVDKFHLVPFGEYQPAWLPWLQIIPGGGFRPGPGPGVLQVQGVPPAGVLICYEAIFPGQVVDQAHRPDWLVNVTNDAWFGNSSGPRQHLAAARMRAVEEGLPLLRAANTGISAGFDAFGRELGRLPIGEPGVLVEKLPGRIGPTWFSRIGLLLPASLAAGVLLCALIASMRRDESLDARE